MWRPNVPVYVGAGRPIYHRASWRFFVHLRRCYRPIAVGTSVVAPCFFSIRISENTLTRFHSQFSLQFALSERIREKNRKNNVRLHQNNILSTLIRVKLRCYWSIFITCKLRFLSSGKFKFRMNEIKNE